MTRHEVKAEVLEILARGDRDSKIEGESLWTRVEALMFFGASASEFRGMSDAALTDSEVCELAEFRLPTRSYPMLHPYLDALIERCV